MSEDFPEPGVRLRAGPSCGRIHRIGTARFKTDAMYLASDCELATYLWVYYMRPALHIAAQVDCEPFETGRIADELRISHPRKRNGEARVISTDLVATVAKDGESSVEALNVKYWTFDVKKPSFGRLCSIEARYYTSRGGEWYLVRSRGLNTNWARNFFYLYPTSDLYFFEGFNDAQLTAQDMFLRRLRNPRGDVTVGDVCRNLQKDSQLGNGVAARAYRELLATKRLWTDMNVDDLMQIAPSALVRNSPELVMT
ncbi:hypothetical protein WN982_40020 [Paraburkholderia sp. IMGN_8]|uniref:hypothetical protein n=1 Tax=Paraburkholderia sp. IMGN_8 TaxID=3136564 RepID=UPI00310198CB